MNFSSGESVDLESLRAQMREPQRLKGSFMHETVLNATHANLGKPSLKKKFKFLNLRLTPSYFWKKLKHFFLFFRN